MRQRIRKTIYKFAIPSGEEQEKTSGGSIDKHFSIGQEYCLERALVKTDPLPSLLIYVLVLHHNNWRRFAF